MLAMTQAIAVVIVVFLLSAAPTQAETITWFAANQVFSVSPHADFFVGSGLTVGTPWSLTVSFDHAAPPLHTIFPGCNQYGGVSSTLKLGSYSYANSGGSIFTNAALPEIGCSGGLAEGLSGNINFWYPTQSWHSDDPGAWNIAAWGGITFAAYYDQLVRDGTLPLTPTVNPIGGRYQGFEIENNAFLGTLIDGGPANFQRLDDAPSPVPEPATLMMMGTGLALIARRRGRR